MEQYRMIMDFETRSTANLKKTGAYKYSMHPTTRPTCLAYKYGQSETRLMNFEQINLVWNNQPASFRKWWTGLILKGCLFVGHNVFFERCIYTNVLVKRYGWPNIPTNQWRCTAAKAAACALPRNLEGAGEALKLRVQKDRRGYVAMMATCKPTKKYGDWHKMMAAIEIRRCCGRSLTPKQAKWISNLVNKKRPECFLEPETSPEVFQTLYDYCIIDVNSEHELDRAIPDLIPQEIEIWQHNQELNWRGLKVDLPTAKKVVGIMAIEGEEKLKELDSLTMGLVTKAGARQSILDFLAIEGIVIPDIRKNTVDDSLKGFKLTEDARRLLEIRKALSLTSTKKYQAMIDRADENGRVRDITLYHRASTGRDGGVGLQPHNFPRGLMKVNKLRPYAHVLNVVRQDHEMLKLLYGNSLGYLFSSILRSMIMASDGCELFVADFAKVEVAVLWWLSGNEPGLNVLRSGKDPYKYQAAANTGKSYDEISDEGPERQLGKGQILGCGFGMGGAKFQKTAWDQYRLKLTLEQSKAAVSSYRTANAAVPAVWKSYEKAAVLAVQHGGEYKAGRCKFIFDKYKRYGGLKFLWVELPSGRRLAYADPQITWRVREFEQTIELEDGTTKTVTKRTEPMETLEFWAPDSKTKKWGLERTWGGTLCENITQAVARDLMMSSIVKLEKAGYRALLTVHDEAICEREKDVGSVDEFQEIMCAPPPWSSGLPISAGAWSAERYRK